MTHILAAGDHFVTPRLFRDAISELHPADDLDYTDLTLNWPMDPFGDVEEVHEASGSVDDLIAALDGVDVAVTQMAPFTTRVFEARPELAMIGVCRGGPVNVDLEAATEAGVVVSFAPGRNAQAAAEFAVGMILSAMRRIPLIDAELKRGTWRGDYYALENVGGELGGSTVGLVGYGAIGRIVARILRGFGAHVVTYDPYADRTAIEADHVEVVELEDLLSRSSVVSLHARLGPETHHLLGRDNLGLLPRGAVLVNTARGGLLDYAPLPDLLESGALGALALDVYDIEPPPEDWPLFRAPNVVLSPHLGGATRQTAERAAAIVAADVVRHLGGVDPQHVANPEVLQRRGVGARP